MGQVIFTINSTIEGTAGHEYGIADAELHEFHTEMLQRADVIVFGRNTYRLMEDFWPTAAKQPGVTDYMLRFAETINSMPKVVISRSLKQVNWHNTTLVNGDAGAEMKQLKEQYNRIAVGGLQLAASLADLDLIDEYWFLLQPFLVGRQDWVNGKPPKLFEQLQHTRKLALIEAKALHSGVVALHYKSVSQS
ncbi:MAG: dihydrofolate reductase family protein [Flavisolibacter sp.]